MTDTEAVSVMFQKDNGKKLQNFGKVLFDLPSALKFTGHLKLIQIFFQNLFLSQSKVENNFQSYDEMIVRTF